MLKKKLFASWDRFMVPYPFSRGIFLWGTPIAVSPDATAIEMEQTRAQLEETLNRMTLEADQAVSRTSL